MTAFDDSTTVALSVTAAVLGVLVYLWVALALSALFRKSGEEPWQGWVPILNLVVVLRLGGLSGWLLLLLLVPFAGPIAVWVCLVVAAHRINLAFGYGGGMTVLAALLFPVWATVLGAGSARWIGRERSSAGPMRSGSADVPPPPPLPGDAPWPVAPPPVYPPSAPVAPPPVSGRAASDPLPPREGWTPPPLPRTAAAGGMALGYEDTSDWTGEVTGAVAGAPAPISAVPPAVAPAVPAAPPMAAPAGAADGPRSAGRVPDEPPVTRVPAAPPVVAREPWAPLPSPMPSESEAFAETSGPVSAIASAPYAGTPRSALASVSAQHAQSHIPDDDPFDETVVARRKRTGWVIVPPAGPPIPLTSAVVLVGRRPVADDADQGAQLVAIDDETRTVSKTHARLELRDDRWYITDLGSTNGVLFTTLMGSEVAATPGEEAEAGDRFLLGDADIRLLRSDG